MSQQSDTPLSSVPGWSGDHARKLAGHWITTAEQVVDMSTTPQGVPYAGTYTGAWNGTRTK